MPQIVLYDYENGATHDYQLIYDPDGNAPDMGNIIAHFDSDPGIDNNDIYVEVSLG